MRAVNFFICVLIYSKEEEFQVDASPVFPRNSAYGHNKKLGKMKNLLLKLAINACPPNVMINVTGHKVVELYKGPEVELLKVFQQKYNFRYEMKQPADGEWGRLVNGQWTGLIRMVQDEEVDIASGCITLTAPRYDAVSFSMPYDIQKSVIVTRKPNVKSKVYAVLMPFSLEVWMLILLSLVVFSVILYIIGQSYWMIFSIKPLQFDKIFWYLLGSFSSEGGKLADVGGSAAVIVVGTWFIFVLVMQSCYSGTLMRVLSFQGNEPTINNMDDVATAINERGFKCGCIKGTFHQATIMELTGRLKVIKDTMMQDKTTLVRSVKQGLVKTLNEKYVFLAQEAECMYVAGNMGESNLFMSKESLDFEAFSFALKKGFPYTEKFNSIILKAFEAGLIDKWRKDLTFKHDSSIFNPNIKNVAAMPLTMTEMHGALMLCVYGLTLATLVLFIEKIRSDKGTRKRSFNFIL